MLTNELNVKNKQLALHSFFETYSCDIEGTLLEMNAQEVLEHLGSFCGESSDDKTDPNNYTPDDIFVGVASAATGINEHEFLKYALKHFGHV